jgi:hypothetical protein
VSAYDFVCPGCRAIHSIFCDDDDLGRGIVLNSCVPKDEYSVSYYEDVLRPRRQQEKKS